LLGWGFRGFGVLDKGFFCFWAMDVMGALCGYRVLGFV
jgi:hypothetical protein